MTDNDDELMPLDEVVRRMVIRQPPTPAQRPCEDRPTADGDDVVDANEETEGEE